MVIFAGYHKIFATCSVVSACKFTGARTSTRKVVRVELIAEADPQVQKRSLRRRQGAA